MKNKSRTTYVLSFMLISFILSSCVKTGIKAINGLSKHGDFVLHENIRYGTHNDNLLDIYLPKNQKPKASIIFFYGGCWGQCSKLSKHDYLFLAETLTKNGYAVIIPDYRKYPEVKFDEILADAKRSVIWTISQSADYNIDNNIFLMGHSAGAHIAAMLADDESQLNEYHAGIKGFIGLAGPYNFYPFNGQYMYDLFDPKDDYFASQPIHFINGNEPPHLLLQGIPDKRVFKHNAIDMAKKLDANNIPNELILLEKTSHTKIILSFTKLFRKKTKVLSSIVSFIDKNL